MSRMDCGALFLHIFLIGLSSAHGTADDRREGKVIVRRGNAAASADQIDARISNHGHVHAHRRHAKHKAHGKHSERLVRSKAVQHHEDHEHSAAACNYIQANPPETDRTYSSVWGGDAVGQGHHRSKLDSAQAWSSQTNQATSWMKIDLGSVEEVGGVTMQGRNNYDQWVKQTTVTTSEDGSSWDSAGTCGNTDRNSKKNCDFTPRQARYVKFSGFQWHNHVSMRAAVRRCKICTCSHGAAAAGVTCTTHDAHHCVSCDTGYTLEDGQCRVAECTCTHGTEATGSECDADGVKCSRCETGYHIVAGDCVENACRCTNGEGGTGSDCGVHDEVKCVHCHAGYTLDTSGSDTVCAVEEKSATIGSCPHLLLLAVMILLAPKLR